MAMITVFVNNRLGSRVRVTCDSQDTIGDLKALIGAQIGSQNMRLKIWYRILRDERTLEELEISDGSSLDME